MQNINKDDGDEVIKEKIEETKSSNFTLEIEKFDLANSRKLLREMFSIWQSDSEAISES